MANPLLGHGRAAWTVSASIRTGVSISKRFMTWRPKGIPSTKWSSSLVNESLCKSIAGCRPLTLLAASAHQQQRASILQNLNHQRRMLNLGPLGKFRNDGAASGGSRLENAHDYADDHPDDAVAQAKLMEMLAADQPLQAVRRYESGSFAINDDCTKAYIKALVRSERIGQTNLSRIIPASSSNWGSSASPAAVNGAGMPGLGTESAPLVIEMAEPSTKSQVWRFIRTVIIWLIILSMVTQFMDRGLGGKGAMNNQEIKPESLTDITTFDDVQGVPEAKEELMEVVDFLKNPDVFTRLGGKLPKGVLLTGPPGTGKTLLAKAVAGEAGVPFFYCSGSDFDEMFVGVGARRVRDLFAAAKKKAPCIVFMDEIDAVGGKRSAKDQQFVKMTLNQLLVELDGFGNSDQVIVVAATNFPEMLDPALVRPGRFDTHVTVGLPDIRGREAILKTHAKNVPIKDIEDLRKIARGTPGFSGAELANIVNQAALRASMLRLDSVDIATLEWAKDKIMMGAERKKAVIKPSDLKCTAYHEGGHALCAMFTEGATPVYKATVVPRGQALGMVQQLPEDDVTSITKKELEARLVVCMGGRAAEERIFGIENTTSGASNDLEQATRIAHAMVTKYAFSDKIGPVSVDKAELSGKMGEVVDTEVRRLCEEALKQAHALLDRYDTEHHRLAEALVEYETLTAEEMYAVVQGKKIREQN